MLRQGPVGLLLAHPDVETGGLDLAAVETLQQGGLVHVGAPGDIDDDHAVLHLGESLGVHDGLVAAGSAEDDDVGLGEQLVHGDKAHGLALAALGLGAVDHGEDLGAQGLALVAHHAADAAIADDAHGLAGDLKALGVGLLLPLVLPHGVASDGDAAGAGEEQGDGQLRHGVGGGPGGVLAGDAGGLGVRDVDVVHADAGPDDELQLAALGVVDLLLLDLGGGTDDDGVEVLQRGAQLVGLIELLHDLESVLAELLHSAGVHAVSDQYTNSHNRCSPFVHFRRSPGAPGGRYPSARWGTGASWGVGDIAPIFRCQRKRNQNHFRRGVYVAKIL